MSIAYKSTGTLINELITTQLKILNIGEKPEFINRLKDLQEEIAGRYKNYILVQSLWEELEKTLTELWWEQEVLYKIARKTELKLTEDEMYNGCIAGIKSLKLNKQRSDLTRKIDELLGEQSSTVLEKSWEDV